MAIRKRQQAAWKAKLENRPCARGTGAFPQPRCQRERRVSPNRLAGRWSNRGCPSNASAEKVLLPASTSAEVGMFSDLVEGVAKFANSKSFLLRFQPFLFCSKALSTQSTHGGERLVDRKRLMRNPRVWFYRQTRTLDFQIGLFCFGSGPERVGCKNRKPGRIDTDRAATGAGQFVLSGKNGRSSRLRSFGPPLQEER